MANQQVIQAEILVSGLQVRCPWFESPVPVRRFRILCFRLGPFSPFCLLEPDLSIPGAHHLSPVLQPGFCHVLPQEYRSGSSHRGSNRPVVLLDRELSRNYRWDPRGRKPVSRGPGTWYRRNCHGLYRATSSTCSLDYLYRRFWYGGKACRHACHSRFCSDSLSPGMADSQGCRDKVSRLVPGGKGSGSQDRDKTGKA